MRTASGNNKQLAINMTATVISVIINLAISFFLTPFVVAHLGVSAYGFVGLASNIIGYSQLITIALNSMAGRFITIKYAQGDIVGANEYFSSVFYSNIFLCSIIVFIFGISIYYLEYFLVIPSHIILDVKCLCSLLLCNSAIGLLTNVYAVSTFIKNRLELAAIRNMIGSFLRAFILFFLFFFFDARLWFVGIAGLFATTYVALTNFSYKKLLTPDLLLSKSLYRLNRTFELVKSGVWNLVTKVGDILQRGLDLLLANVFIGSAEMGILSITTFAPFVILQFFSTISSNFAPTLTVSYAKGDIKSITIELNKSIRILSVVMLLPLSALYVYGDVFYSLWVPSQDANLLYKLTICGTFALIFTIPFEGFWNIFTVTNKVQYSSLYILFNSIAVFLTVILLLLYVESSFGKMFVIASTRSIWGVLRGVAFLPIYGAKCLNLKWYYFYRSFWKQIGFSIIGIIVLYNIRYLYMPNSWFSLIIAMSVLMLVSLTYSLIVILSSNERHAIRAIVKRK